MCGVENSAAITFIRTDTEEVAAQDVRLIVAELGSDKSAKNKPPVWVRNTIIAGEKRYISTAWPHENSQNFEKWLAACPRAVGITTDGTIRVPQIAQPTGADSLALLRDALSEGRYVLGNYAAKAAAISVPLLLLGGTVITESVFALPGMGRLVLTSVLNRDYQVATGIIFLIAAAFVLINLLVDLLYPVLDPGVRLGRLGA